MVPTVHQLFHQLLHTLTMFIVQIIILISSILVACANIVLHLFIKEIQTVYQVY